MKMANLSATLTNLYSEFTYFPKPDPRTDDWFLMSSIVPVSIICCLYYVVVWQGPKWMKHREPFQIPKILLVYNSILVFLSAVMSFEIIYVAIQDNYSLFGCQPVIQDASPLPVRMAWMAWWYFFSKVIELLDTVFFILRKKERLVTFLHVYHHGTMPFFCWFNARYTPGGTKFFPMAFNSSVHVVMYAYYALCTFGPSIQKYLWWKKYITRFQILQFVCVILHSARGLFLQPCSFPKSVTLFVVVYTSSFLVLFINYYIHEYLKRKRRHVD